MLTQVDDIGADNPMASNIYMCFVLMAVWKAAGGAITPDGFRPVIRKMAKSPMMTKMLSKRDMNNPEELQQSWKGLYERRPGRISARSTGIKPGITISMKKAPGRRLLLLYPVSAEHLRA